MYQSQTQFEQSHAELKSQMEQTDAFIAKIHFRDEQHNIFTEHVGTESQFEIWVENDEIEENDQGR